MKKVILLISLISYSFMSAANCDNAYSSAGYALSHTKKALKSDNFDHQKYYADRALEAFKKTQKLVESCGCAEALNSILDGVENLESAIDPEDWDAGRYFSKRAFANAQDALTAMDICSGNSVAINYAAEGDSNTSLEVTDEIALESQNLNEQQKRLAEEQEKLLQQQRALEQKIEKQRVLANEVRANRQIELEEQFRLKRIAEQSLNSFEKNIQELASIYGCDNAMEIVNNYLSRKDAELNNETLEETRNHYLQQTIAMQSKAMKALQKCASDAASK
ncbi:MAG: hypothetical protein COA50_13195 [Flavobacteriaceae bacterium]|nr:MAG: hypothetical protein COA50_13195 [Flavobacteriaceae bacterium]